MRKLFLLTLSASMGSILTVLLLGLPLNVSAGGGGPLTDNHFCTDADGNGRLDIGDAINILDYLFLGTATPYCIAQDVSLNDLSGQLAQVSARLAVVEARTRHVGNIATGSYVGTGVPHRIETGLSGQLKYVRVWLDCAPRPCGVDEFVDRSAKTDEMPGGSAVNNSGFTLEGSAFIVSSDQINLADRPFTWFAIAEETSN